MPFSSNLDLKHWVLARCHLQNAMLRKDVIDLVVQILLEFFLGIPGAFVLWSINGFKGSYTETWTEKQGKSIFIGLAFWIIVAGIVGFVARSV